MELPDTQPLGQLGIKLNAKGIVKVKKRVKKEIQKLMLLDLPCAGLIGANLVPHKGEI